MRRHALAAMFIVLVFQAQVFSRDETVEISVAAGKHDHENLPVCVPLSLPKDLADHRYALLKGVGHRLEGQLTAPGITTENVPPSAKGLVRRDLHFILPRLAKGETLTLTAKLLAGNPAPYPGSFEWRDQKGEFAELIYSSPSKSDRRPVLRYMYRPYDDSSKEARDRSYKVFHHMYDPAGKRLVTNGGYAGPDLPDNPKKLLFPHHRGLMFGFNKCTYDGKRADTWHCQKDDHQSHEGFLKVEAGPVLGRHRVAVDWHGPGKKVFAREERELTVYKVPGGTLVEFATRLKTTGGPVKLDGDPQHAGFQFRAHNDVAAKTAKQTYYLRPDGKGKPGQTRNWPGHKDQVDLPWYAMSFVLDGKRYTAAYLNHPSNPRPSRFSERDYGRFGCYFVYELTKDRPLVVNYRLWLQDGEMTAAEAAGHHANLAVPPEVTAKQEGPSARSRAE